MLSQFFFGYFLTELPGVFLIFILALIILSLFSKHFKYLAFLKRISFAHLILLLLGGTIFFNLVLTILQYFVWHNQPFTAFLLPPHQSWAYFLRYTFFHFWLADILSLLSASVIYLIFKLLRKYQEKIISLNDLNLLFLACLILGWPKIIFFVPLFLASALVDSSVSIIIFKNRRINLVPSLIVALFLVFFLGNYLINFFNQSVLII